MSSKYGINIPFDAGPDDADPPYNAELQRRLRRIATEVSGLLTGGRLDAVNEAMEVLRGGASSTSSPEDVAGELKRLSADVANLGHAVEPVLARLRALDAMLRQGTDQAGRFNFQPSKEASSPDFYTKVEIYSPPVLYNYLFDETIAQTDRDMLLSRLMNNEDFKDILRERFGCTAEEAVRAESLVLEFLKSSKGLELAELAQPGPPEAKLELPDAPPKYPYAPRMSGGILKYLEDNWLDHIKAGVLTRPALKRIDKPAWTALNNWLTKNELPKHLWFPDRSEIVDAAARGLDPAAIRAAASLRHRQWRAKDPTPK